MPSVVSPTPHLSSLGYLNFSTKRRSSNGACIAYLGLDNNAEILNLEIQMPVLLFISFVN